MRSRGLDQRLDSRSEFLDGQSAALPEFAIKNNVIIPKISLKYLNSQSEGYVALTLTLCGCLLSEGLLKFS
jgi:hypothetical protein